MLAKRELGDVGSGDRQPIVVLHYGVEEWNQWRLANAEAQIDLANSDLRSAQLNGANLAGANLSGTDLTGAQLNGANLVGANLTRAQLNWANLTRANLNGANLTGTKLNGADLSWAFLIGTNLSGAYMVGADLFWADLTKAKLDGALTIGANLIRANLAGADLTRGNLTGTNLSGAFFEDANFSEADLQAALFQMRPFRIYTQSKSIDDANELFARAADLYRALGFSVGKNVGWVEGSLWLREVFAWICGFKNSEFAKGWALIVERIFVGELNANASKELAKAAVDFENAFKGKKGAVAIDIGLFIFLRKPSEDGDGDTFFKRLTVDERALLDDDPALLGNPELLVKEIKGMRKLQAVTAMAQLEAEKDDNKAA